MNGLQLKGAEEEVEPVHGETGTLRDKHGQSQSNIYMPNRNSDFLRCSNYSRYVCVQRTHSKIII